MTGLFIVKFCYGCQFVLVVIRVVVLVSTCRSALVSVLSHDNATWKRLLTPHFEPLNTDYFHIRTH